MSFTWPAAYVKRQCGYRLHGLIDTDVVVQRRQETAYGEHTEDLELRIRPFRTRIRPPASITQTGDGNWARYLATTEAADISPRPRRPGIMVSMRTELITIRTGRRPAVHDLTAACERFVPREDGLLNVFVPHATAGLAIMETGAGSDDDLLTALGQLLPADERWEHRHGSRGHGRDHVLPAIISPSVTVPVVQGQMHLGVWQSICLVDTNVDNPDRDVRLSFVTG